MHDHVSAIEQDGGDLVFVRRMFGSTVAIAGRSIPGNVLSTKREIAMSAPVFPALTQACASPVLTRSMATRIDESFL